MYLCVLERTSAHSAGVNVTLPTALLLQNVAAFGGSRSLPPAAAYCFTKLACLSISAKSV